jgi:hypothetical protein
LINEFLLPTKLTLTDRIDVPVENEMKGPP